MGWSSSEGGVCAQRGRIPPSPAHGAFNAENPSCVSPCGLTDEVRVILPASALLPQGCLKHSMGIKWNEEEHCGKGLESFFPRSLFVEVLGLVCLSYLSYFIKPDIFFCNEGVFHHCLYLTKVKHHGCHWLPIIRADGFIIQIFPKRAGRSITVDVPACWLLQIFPVWMGAKNLCGGDMANCWKSWTSCVAAKMIFFKLHLMLSLHSLGFGGDFLGGIGQTISIPGFYLWCVGIPVVTISARSFGAPPSEQAGPDLSCRQRTDFDPSDLRFILQPLAVKRKEKLTLQFPKHT